MYPLTYGRQHEPASRPAFPAPPRGTPRPPAPRTIINRSLALPFLRLLSTPLPLQLEVEQLRKQAASMRAHVCVPALLAAGFGQRGATAYSHHHYHLTNDTYGLSNATDGYHLGNATQPTITGMCAGNTDPAEDVACPAGFAAKRNTTGDDKPRQHRPQPHHFPACFPCRPAFRGRMLDFVERSALIDVSQAPTS
jgi:hypothetical protein